MKEEEEEKAATDAAAKASEEAKAAEEAAMKAEAEAENKVAAEATASGYEDIEVIGSMKKDSAKAAEGVKNILDSSPEQLDSDWPV